MVVIIVQNAIMDSYIQYCARLQLLFGSITLYLCDASCGILRYPKWISILLCALKVRGITSGTFHHFRKPFAVASHCYSQIFAIASYCSTLLLQQPLIAAPSHYCTSLLLHPTIIAPNSYSSNPYLYQAYLHSL